MFRKKPVFQAAPTAMIVGLGNPGAEYRGTRHNVGFDVIDRLALARKAKMNSSRHRALTTTVEIAGVGVLLVKPLTFMNLSGQAVAPLAKQFGIPLDRILVVADDLDLTTGKLRLKLQGSAGGHNGHKSLIASLRSDEYPRVKIGIGKVDKSSTIDHVLSPFDREERDLIQRSLETAAEVCEEFVAHGYDSALRLIASHNQRVTGSDQD